MHAESASATTMLREGLAVIVDAAGVALLTWFGFQILFGPTRPFVDTAMSIGIVASVGCLLSPGSRRVIPIPLVLYVLVGLISAIANFGWLDRPDWSELTTAASSANHLVVMVVFIFGVAHLLRTPLRLALFVVLLAAATAVIALQLTYDRTVTGYVYDEAGSTSLPSLWQWGGMHQVGLLLCLGFPLLIAPAVARPTWSRVAAATIAGGGMLVAVILSGSRSGILTILIVAVAMPLLGSIRTVFDAQRVRLRSTAFRTITIIVVWTVIVGAAGAALFLRGSIVRPIRSVSGGRAPIWRAATQITIDHPVLGVGPGNYTRTMVMDGYAKRFLPDYPAVSGTEQAHNWFLQVSSETGITGLLCFVAFCGWLLWRCGRGLAEPGLLTISYGVLFLVVAMLVRSSYDSFLDNLVTSDRTRPLFWLVFAAALSRARLLRIGNAA